ncbi:MAG: hypothetical protein P8018_04465, partial [Acidobacteriota bacterium]
IELNNSDPSSSLSMLPKDAWTIDSADGTFTINDPGGYITQPLPDIHDTVPTAVTSTYPTRYEITLLTQQWLQDNASGMIGTTDVATVTLDITFHAHRNRDGLQKTITDQFQFTISDY